MTIIIYAFIILAIVMAMFCMFVMARDVIIEERERRQKKEELGCKPPVAYNQPAPVLEDQPAPKKEEASAKELAKEEVAPTITDDSAIVFSATQQTLDEKYLELSQEHKSYYDEIVKFAMAVEGSKRFKNESYEEYKVGKTRIVRLKIKRGVIVCELVIPNLTFKTYVADNKVAMKQAPATIKVIDEATFNAVKESIKIAVKAMEEEKAYRKEQAKLRRKQKRESEREKASAIAE